MERNESRMAGGDEMSQMCHVISYVSLSTKRKYAQVKTNQGNLTQLIANN